MLRDAAHFFDAVANRLAGHKASLNRRGTESVITRQRRRCRLLAISDKVIEAHKLALVVLDRKHRNVFGHAAVLITNRTNDIILAAVLVEFTITLVTNRKLHRLGDIVHRHSFFIRLVTQNFNMEFRLGKAQVAIHHAKHRALARFFFELGHKGSQNFDIRRLQHKLHREAASLRTDTLRFEHHHAQVGIFVSENLNGMRNFTLRPTSLFVVIQRNAHSGIARIPSTRLDF